MLQEVHDLFVYWNKMPPAHVSLVRIVEALKGLLGGSGGETPSVSDVMSSGSKQQGNVQDLLSMFPSGTIS